MIKRFTVLVLGRVVITVNFIYRLDNNVKICDLFLLSYVTFLMNGLGENVKRALFQAKRGHCQSTLAAWSGLCSLICRINLKVIQTWWTRKELLKGLSKLFSHELSTVSCANLPTQNFECYYKSKGS